MSALEYIGLAAVAALCIVAAGGVIAWAMRGEPTDIDNRLSAADDEIRNRPRLG